MRLRRKRPTPLRPEHEAALNSKPLSSAKAMALGALGLSPQMRRDLEQSNERAEAMNRAMRRIDETRR